MINVSKSGLFGVKIKVFTLAILFSFSSFAQVPVKAGEAVPFDGILLTKGEVAKILAEKEALKKRYELELEHAKKRHDLEKDLIISNGKLSLDTEREKYTSMNKMKAKEIERLYTVLEAESGGEFTPLWFGSGIVLGAAASIVIFFAAVQTTRMGVIPPFTELTEVTGIQGEDGIIRRPQ